MKVKSYIKNNKKVYVTGAVCLIVGATGAALYLRSKYPTEVAQKIVQIGYKNKATIELVYLGHPGNALQCVEDGTVYMSQGEAAKLLGVSKGTVTRHLQGKQADIAGKTLQKISDRGVVLSQE